MERLKELLELKEIDAASLAPLFDSGAGQVYCLTRSGAGAIDAWRALRTALAGHGWWPVLLGDVRDLDTFAEAYSYESRSPREILEAAAAVDPAEVLARKREVYGESLGEAEEEPEWAVEAVPNTTFTIPTNILTGRPLERVTIALVPTDATWEAPAYLKFGGWNECLEPEEHVALMRRWNEQYGAEVVGITSAVVEMLVSRPPSTLERAMELAREQYVYCPDIVDQGTGTILALAETLLDAPVWYFWWD
jgi:hypothetical protein